MALWGELSESLGRVAGTQRAVVASLFRSSVKPIGPWLVNCMMKDCSYNVPSRIKDNPGLLPYILKFPSLSTEDGLHHQLLRISTDFLVTAYNISERKSLALDVIAALALSLKSLPQEQVVDVLRFIQPCVTLWVDDSGDKLDTEELEHLVRFKL